MIFERRLGLATALTALALGFGCDHSEVSTPAGNTTSDTGSVVSGNAPAGTGTTTGTTSTDTGGAAGTNAPPDGSGKGSGTETTPTP